MTSSSHLVPARPPGAGGVLVPSASPPLRGGTRTAHLVPDGVQLVPAGDEDAQLELFSPFDDGLDFGEWMERLPSEGQA